MAETRPEARIYNSDEFEIINERNNKKLVRLLENDRMIILNNSNVEKRNFTFSINNYDKEDLEFMSFVMNQEDLNKTFHYLILEFIKDHGTKNLKFNRYNQLI